MNFGGDGHVERLNVASGSGTKDATEPLTEPEFPPDAAKNKTFFVTCIQQSVDGPRAHDDQIAHRPLLGEPGLLVNSVGRQVDRAKVDAAQIRSSGIVKGELGEEIPWRLAFPCLVVTANAGIIEPPWISIDEAKLEGDGLPVEAQKIDAQQAGLAHGGEQTEQLRARARVKRTVDAIALPTTIEADDQLCFKVSYGHGGAGEFHGAQGAHGLQLGTSAALIRAKLFAAACKVTHRTASGVHEAISRRLSFSDAPTTDSGGGTHGGLEPGNRGVEEVQKQDLPAEVARGKIKELIDFCRGILVGYSKETGGMSCRDVGSEAE